ncbi:calcium-binding protein [Microvirga solisilvae]|uniref:calcium-binding protein n=1 Tax=Microvirga solisilvae TaxID=2919498 RepID=UPI001FAF2B04|nr:calcium-binding protein [Microvirga solisilvae]
MTEYVADRSRVLLDDYTTMYNLLPGDTLWVAPGVWLDVQAANSSVAVLSGNSKLGLIAEFFSPSLVSSIGNTFIGTGDRISVDIGRHFTVASLKSYVLYLEGSSNTIVNDGLIRSGSENGVIIGRGGIYSGGMTHLINDGAITNGKTGVYFSAGGNTVHNSGLIDGENHALRIMGGNNVITNESHIGNWGNNGAAIYMTSGGGGTNMINNRGGLIEGYAYGGSYAIQVTGLSHDTIWNNPGRAGTPFEKGLIRGNIDLGLGNDEIVNRGEIRGSINMGSGHDTITNTGTIYGDVQLGAGNDMFDGALGQHSANYSQKFAAIFGGDGADTIIGGAKNEVISGGAGQDYLVGNGGQDTFWFDVAPVAGQADDIVEFNIAEDRIWLSAAIFGLGTGQLSAEQFCYGTKAQDATDRIVYNTSTGALAFDRDGTGSTYSAVVFAMLDPETALRADHLFIV